MVHCIIDCYAVRSAFVIHFPSELPEYKDICDKHREEDLKIAQYRKACKDEAFHLFVEWFYELYD